jgi:hypothetical protein
MLQDVLRKSSKALTTASVGDVSGTELSGVPVLLMKRDLLFVAERLASVLDENRLSIIARRYSIRKAKDNDSLAKLFEAYLRRAEESVLGSVLVETTILYMSTRHNPAQVLPEAAANMRLLCVSILPQGIHGAVIFCHRTILYKITVPTMCGVERVLALARMCLFPSRFTQIPLTKHSQNKVPTGGVINRVLERHSS